MTNINSRRLDRKRMRFWAYFVTRYQGWQCWKGRHESSVLLWTGDCDVIWIELMLRGRISKLLSKFNSPRAYIKPLYYIFRIAVHTKVTFPRSHPAQRNDSQVRQFTDAILEELYALCLELCLCCFHEYNFPIHPRRSSVELLWCCGDGDEPLNFVTIRSFFLQTPRVLPFTRKFILLVNIVLWLHCLIITLLCQLPVT
jgi:hypothetical protein